MWCVYLLECSDSSYYCGISNNFEKRLKAHNSCKGAKYTKTRLPVSLITKADGFTRSEAAKLEYKVKKKPRNKKIDYLNSMIVI